MCIIYFLLPLPPLSFSLLQRWTFSIYISVRLLVRFFNVRMVFGVTDNVCQGYSRMCKLCKLSVTNCKIKYLGWYGILHSSLRPFSSNSRYFTVNVLTLQLPVIFLYFFNNHLFKRFLKFFSISLFLYTILSHPFIFLSSTICLYLFLSLFFSLFLLSIFFSIFPLSFFSFFSLISALSHLINGSRHCFYSYIFLFACK